ncbi:hypothetical protein EW146_g4482 [Bondarzewia mesenterica]|uniref:SH3 domain-containing protein n=1 Tax=Bondarzewia mesenterica TaxID=1095465 RepID=A0A4V3XF45_9AGAM|nr:hypothetical protein EW146_g4482 [Bondarzewia mesenterica]
MAPYTPHTLFSRDTTNNSNNKITPVVIAGFSVAGVIVLAIVAWLIIRFYRKRSQKERKEERNGAFLTVKGIVKEWEDEKEASTVTSNPNVFSRTQIGRSIVMPNKSIVRPDATKEEIIQYHKDIGTITRPFSFSLNPPRISGHSPSNSSSGRPVSTVSFLTADFSPRRSSFMSFDKRSSTASAFSTSSSSRGVEKRKVRQLFNPVLPDELVINLGEKITVVQSFDDGWCIVGRDSVFKSGDIEMGAVPAWVFVKPIKGLKASRPMRSSSLGVTVEMDAGPGFSSRDELVSWSNF